MPSLSESLGFLLICWGVGWAARLGWPRRGLRAAVIAVTGLFLTIAGVWRAPEWLVLGAGTGALSVWFWEKSRAARRAREREGQALVHLHALRGLLRGGLSLPSALFQLVEADSTPLGTALRRHLKGFHRGEQLAVCLRQFRERSGLKGSAPLWGVLEMAYQRGLPLIPVLERSLPALEAEADALYRMEELRKSAAGQGLVVAALPWGMLAVLSFFQLEVVAGFLEADAFLPTILASLALELGGLFALWRACAFAHPDLELLLSRVDLVALHLAAGFDLAYSWSEAGLENLESLAAGHPDPWRRVWFSALLDLYRQGAPIQPLVIAFADELRKEGARARERHGRQLPTRVNVLLILFFLPAAFLLIFMPLLLQVRLAFSP